jgi:hypothetical protein
VPTDLKHDRRLRRDDLRHADARGLPHLGLCQTDPGVLHQRRSAMVFKDEVAPKTPRVEPAEAPVAASAERARLLDDARGVARWKLWGPYLSERQWGTVREDYSPNGNAWDYLSHDQARARAYRWGEDGIAGISDISQRLCLALVLWNGRDPILKERLFGLTNAEGNHGEDVKDLYYYLDATPTHLLPSA